MIRLARKMNLIAVVFAVLFMILQIYCDLKLPTLTANIVNKGILQQDVDYIWQVGMKMMGYSLVSILAATGNVFLAARESQGLGRKLRDEIYEKVTYFGQDEINQVGTSSLITRTTNDVIQIQNVMMMFLRMMIMSPIMLIGASWLAYTQDKNLTKVFLVMLPILALFMGFILLFAVPLFRKMQIKTDRLNLVFREGLTGVRVIRAFNRTKYEADRFDEANLDFMDNSVKVQTIMSFMLPVVTFVMSITNIAITWFGAHYIADGSMQAGSLISFTTYAMQVMISFMMLSMVFVFIPRGQASAKRIVEVLAINNSIVDKKATQETDTKNENLRFEQVGFTFHGAERAALADVSFEAQPGEVIAVIGGTGSGKSTFAQLISRFHDVTTGSVQLNGKDIRQYGLKELRSHISFVPQKAILFSGTIRDNLRYGNEQASDALLWEALEVAQAKNFVEELEAGLDSHVEQGGGNFSGGQRQRLCIARALVKKAEVTVFDDSFSALDFKTDAALRQALKPVMKESIMIIIAQRISTVVDANRIIVLEEGKVVGSGTHQELKATNETYQEILESQMKGDDLA